MTNKAYTREFFESSEQYARAAAREIVPIVMQVAHPRSVVDVGCGAGVWLSVFREHHVDDVLGVDGNYVARDQLAIQPQEFRAADLNAPLEIDREFDLAMSLEVAEHLAPTVAERFISDLTRLAPLVLFSAAIPFQGGVDHRNEQWQGYWAALFSERDYVPIDCIRGRVWSNPNVTWYYAQNVILYGRRALVESDLALSSERTKCGGGPINIVHPTKYLSVADVANVPLRRVLRQLPTLFLHGVRRTFSRSSRKRTATPAPGSPRA